MRILVLSSLFPSSVRPQAGLFVRERMFRVAKHADLEVVSPVPWFPGQGLLRLVKPGYRPQPAALEEQNGIKVHFPRFLSLPMLGRRFDAWMMARCCRRLIKKLHRHKAIDLIDSHFTYPDGLAATQLAKMLGCPVTITLRGTELSHSRDPSRCKQLLKAWQAADKLICVSDSLRQLAISLGAPAEKLVVVGNGIDTEKFKALNKAEARHSLGIDEDARVLVTVGGLVPRKGFHRVIDCIPTLLKSHPKLIYLVVGGASAEGNYEPQLRKQVQNLDLEEQVRFMGPLPPDKLSLPLSAADVFVLSTANEGWANVILEAMACGTPVVATDVGGNAEVVRQPDTGTIVPFDDHQALSGALGSALAHAWQTQMIVDYAADNHWDKRVTQLIAIFAQLTQERR
ncbi:glycosyltransferase [Bowmanella denitrificans]|uniref:glycosyltransferase n=1 Tax=Bowmanella denitrificans TaxID=366582 RepID=UPI001FE2544A|nr:glycosyltransferase [Bowmanella denitrificans]